MRRKEKNDFMIISCDFALKLAIFCEWLSHKKNSFVKMANFTTKFTKDSQRTQKRIEKQPTL